MPDDAVVLNNLPAHKLASLAELVEARGARLLYLPPYSPDFDPIELAFSKLKTWLRTVQARLRAAVASGSIMPLASTAEVYTNTSSCGPASRLLWS